MVIAWIGVGSSYPTSLTLLRIESLRPRSENVSVSLSRFRSRAGAAATMGASFCSSSSLYDESMNCTGSSTISLTSTDSIGSPISITSMTSTSGSAAVSVATAAFLARDRFGFSSSAVVAGSAVSTEAAAAFFEARGFFAGVSSATASAARPLSCKISAASSSGVAALRARRFGLISSAVTSHIVLCAYVWNAAAVHPHCRTDAGVNTTQRTAGGGIP